uniref:Transcriptional regulator, GntR family domain / aspartate aminotransferase n=1 Tax=uncultured bacterium contig00029 TaxID=1181518 RepID=A0A806KC10_9BACT|nr:transcriptional regulator, GntR family domain / aspartate aminotransferase [uncultured bacterium contig00029]
MTFTISDRLKNVSGSAIREIFELLKSGDIISFAGGMPSAQTLPAKEIDDILNGIVSRYGAIECLQYESTFGKARLMQSLKPFLAEYKNLSAENENMIVLSGAQQCIDFACKTFVNKGDVVLVQNPTYLSVLQIVATYEGKCVGVNSSEDGLDIKDLEEKMRKHKPKLLYAVPTFSNPSSGEYTLQNRKAIAELTARHGVMVLEDDPYSEIRFEGEKLPPLKSFDTAGNIIYVASFSKIISPSLRVAVAVCDPAIIAKFNISKQSTDVCSSSLSQLIVSEFLQGDALKKHLANIIPAYRKKRDKMAECIKQHMPASFKCNAARGGMFLWGEFPDGRDLMPDFRKLIDKKVAFLPGTHFFAGGEGKNTMRLNFSNASPEQIEQGVRVMGEHFR